MKLCLQKLIKYLHKSQESIKILTAKTKVSVQDQKSWLNSQIFDFGISQSWTQSVIRLQKNQEPKFMSVLELKQGNTHRFKEGNCFT